MKQKAMKEERSQQDKGEEAICKGGDISLGKRKANELGFVRMVPTPLHKSAF